MLLQCDHYGKESQRSKKVVIKECKYCGKEFTTITGAKSSTFCSRSCASKGSVTDYRRDKALEVSRKNFVHGGTQGLEQIANMMKKREGWKYVELKELLNSLDIKHEFEYVLQQTIFTILYFLTKNSSLSLTDQTTRHRSKQLMMMSKEWLQQLLEIGTLYELKYHRVLL